MWLHLIILSHKQSRNVSGKDIVVATCVPILATKNNIHTAQRRRNRPHSVGKTNKLAHNKSITKMLAKLLVNLIKYKTVI